MRLVPISASAILCLGFPVLWRAGCEEPNRLQADQQAPVTTSPGAQVQAPPPGSNEPSVVASLDTQDFELRDWLAFGSGCRSRASAPGDVDLHVFEDPDAPGIYRFHFNLAHYGITPSDPLLAQVPAFARECGIRLAIYPKPGSKLANVTTRPVYHVDKGLGPEVRLRSRLFTGNSLLGLFEKRFAVTQSVSAQQEETSWQTGENAVTVFESLACEQPKIVGLDLSVAVIRSQLGDEKVTATLDQGELELTLEFASCGTPITNDGVP